MSTKKHDSRGWLKSQVPYCAKPMIKTTCYARKIAVDCPLWLVGKVAIENSVIVLVMSFISPNKDIFANGKVNAVNVIMCGMNEKRLWLASTVVIAN